VSVRQPDLKRIFNFPNQAWLKVLFCVLAAAGLEKGKKCPLALASERRGA
jgi:hypothetical protein